MIARLTVAVVIALAAPLSLAAADKPPASGEIPVPTMRPDKTDSSPAQYPDMPSGQPPLPQDKPMVPPNGAIAPAAQDDKATTEPSKSEPNPPPVQEDEADYAACLSALRELGAEFEERPPIDDGDGCGIEKPLVVSSILPGVAVKPEATLRCKAALQLSHWIKDSVIPAGNVAFGTGKQIKTVDEATSYMCRSRNHAESGKLSEHARGNAIDIAGFTFSDGSALSIAPRQRDSTMEGAFERAVMATACLYFTTVLGPGSDDAHETHLHLDIIERKADYRYCW
jgi:hypothetical protein